MNMKKITLITGFGLMTTLVPFIASGEPAKAPKEYIAMKNPFKPLPDVLAEGETIYMDSCKKCHGDKGDGKGSGAKKLDPKPTAFNDKAYMSKRSDGQLFYITEKGSPKTDMDAMGPDTDVDLSKDKIWKVITYIRHTFAK